MFTNSLFMTSGPKYSPPAQSGGNSLRFNSPDVARLSNTSVASPTNDKKFTQSFWFKRGTISQLMSIVGPLDDIRINADDTFGVIGGGGVTVYRQSLTKFRDPTGWYHFVLSWDTANATAADRLKVYVNGVEFTNWGTNNTIAQNYQHLFNKASTVRYISTYNGTTWPGDGYYAEFICVDGQNLPPTSFGRFSPTTGSWEPILYTGSFGNNGFRLDFSDNSNTTSTTLGKDRSGNNNDWTPTNFSVTAGIGNDCLRDSPGLSTTPNISGNYCTLSPINKHSLATCTLSNGNLQFLSSNAGNYVFACGTHKIDSQKIYFEMTAGLSTYSTAGAGIGIATDGFYSAGLITGDNVNTATTVWKYLQDGTKKTGTTATSFGSTYTTNDVIGVAIDATSISNIKIWFSKNGTWQASGDPVAGTNPAYSGIVGPVVPIVQNISNSTSGGDYLNFGQRAFASTIPSGYTVLCSAALPDPAIKNPKTRFDVHERIGTGSAGSKTGLLFQPDAIISKQRSSTGLTIPMTTALRGTGKYNPLNAAAEVTDAQAITALNSNGYSFGTAAVMNTNATSYVIRSWKSDPSNGFEIITWTGDGLATKNISHTLGIKPSMVWAHSVGATTTYLWHKNNIDVVGSDGSFQTIWNLANSDVSVTNTPYSAMSSSTITVTNNATNNLNSNGIVYVAYLFADGPLFASGKFTGNASTDGPVFYCGFKPAYVGWYAYNNSTYMGLDQSISNNYNGSTTMNVDNLLTYGVDFYSYAPGADFLSQGFKIRSSAANVNISGFTRTWFAFAEQAGKYSRAV